MYLGIDLGTSGVKVLLIDDAQRPVDEAHAPLEVQRPHPGWSEQRPADWVAAVSACLDALAARRSLGMVRGIGLSGHMHGATLLDRADNVLRPCILWNDTRAHAEAAALDADPDFRAISGNIVFPGFTAPKLVWVATHEPEIFARVAKVLLPKDYLRLWLTGEAVSEPSDAAGTSWLDTGARNWSDTLLAKTGLDRGQMPARPSRAASGPRSPAAGALTRAWWWRAAAATTRPRPSASARSPRAAPSSRWGPRVSSSPPPAATAPMRPVRSTPSATPSPTPGTRWG
jgi:xylulokinase